MKTYVKTVVKNNFQPNEYYTDRWLEAHCCHSHAVPRMLVILYPLAEE